MIIGITGGIGSGKSTIAHELAQRGYAVYDCDREAKRIVEENREVQARIIALLGEDAFVHGRYNTSFVSKKVFYSSPIGEGRGETPSLLSQLNAIIHPAVVEDIKHLPSFQGGDGCRPLLFLESAILFEAGLDRLCDCIVVVDAPEEVRIACTIHRDYNGDASPEHINSVRARMHAQNPPHLSPENSNTIVLSNDGTRSVSNLVEILLKTLHERQYVS